MKKAVSEFDNRTMWINDYFHTDSWNWVIYLLFLNSSMFFCLQLYAVIIYLIVTIKGARIHWVEIHEEEWCPSFFLFFLQKCLQIGWQFFGMNECFGSPADSIASVIVQQLQSFNCHSILDLCSGSCGPSSYLNQRINGKFQEISDNNKAIVTILTDLYPHSSNWKRLTNESNTLTYCEKSVDATKVPLDEIDTILDKFNHIENIKNSKNGNSSIRIRTLFGSFHHFNKAQAIGILQNAIESGDAFIMGEMVIYRGNVFDFLKWAIIIALITPLNWIHLTLHFLKQSKINESNLFLSIIKIICMFILTPLWYMLFVHDAIISCARIYLEDELMQMTQEAINQAKEKKKNVLKYKWKAKRLRSNMLFPLNILMPYTILMVVPQVDTVLSVSSKKRR